MTKEEHENFVQHSYFTFLRSEKICTGVWSADHGVNTKAIYEMLWKARTWTRNK